MSLPPTSSDKIDILLVDDMPDKLLALETVLAELNQNIVQVRSGREALRLLLKQDFAVILLDINMPGMDGFETASLIRQRESCAHTPIIFVTAFSTGDEEVYRGYSLGAVDYLFTPIIPEVLRSKVSVFIDLQRKSREIQRQAEALRKIEEERLNRQLTETTERLEWEARRNYFFRLSIELLAISNYTGQFSQVNPTWEKILGHSENDLRGKSLMDFIHSSDQEHTRSTIASITKADTSLYFENRFRAKDGSYHWLGWTIAPFAAEGLLYIFARDITERHEREQEIRQLNEDLKKHAVSLQTINQELESFSYSIAHDLRTPLIAISGYSDIVLGGEAGQIPAEATKLIKAVNRNSTYMAKLIDDFLVFFRLGRQEVMSGYIDMPTVAKEAVTAVRPVNSQRKIEFKLRDLPGASGDAAMVRQVFVNLISNAVKFSGTREKAVIEIGSVENSSPTIYFVKDNGVGFDMQYYSKLFGVFQRLHTRSEFDGTGIGLAVVNKIVQRHGGRVWAEAVLDKGATFFFTLKAS